MFYAINVEEVCCNGIGVLVIYLIPMYDMPKTTSSLSCALFLWG